MSLGTGQYNSCNLELFNKSQIGDILQEAVTEWSDPRPFETPW